MTPEDLNRQFSGTLSGLIGMRVVEAGADRVVAELEIRDDLCTVGGALHGGTLMALADTIGDGVDATDVPFNSAFPSVAYPTWGSDADPH